MELLVYFLAFALLFTFLIFLGLFFHYFGW